MNYVDFGFFDSIKAKFNRGKVTPPSNQLSSSKKLNNINNQSKKVKSNIPSGDDSRYFQGAPVRSPKSLEQLEEIRKIVFDPNFKRELDGYNKVMGNLHKSIGNLINSTLINGIMIFGAPGMGKTHSLLDALNTMKKKGVNLNYWIIKGKVTPLQLYEFVKQHQNKNDICIFDDCDSIFFDTESMNLVKAMSDTYPERVVSYRSRSASDPSFVFKGKLICITNQDLNGNAHFTALKDRMPLFSLDLTFMQKFAKSIDVTISDPRYMHDPKYKESADFIISYMNKHIQAFNIPEYSLRTVIRLLGIYELVGPDGFDTFVHGMKEFNWHKVKSKSLGR